jgi:outer membrane protein
MKNLSLILNIVLLVAVAVLFYFQFSGSKPKTYSSFNDSDTSASNLKVAYISTDTVLKYYEYRSANTKILEAKAQRMGQDYQTRVTGLQREVSAYQANVASMTLGQARATEEDLAKKQQNLQMYQQSLSQQLQEDEAKMQNEIYIRLTNFLKTYGQERGLEVVLKFDGGSDLLYGRPTLDISQDVIKGLNELYQQEKGTKPAAKADSTAKKK